MPKERFVPRRITLQESVLAERFLEDSDYVASARRYAGYFKNFLDKNPLLLQADTNTAFAHFFAQFILSGRSVQTVVSMMRTLRRFGVTVEHPNGIAERYLAENLNCAIRSGSKDTDAIRTKYTHTYEELVQPCWHAEEGPADQEMQCFYFVLVATGNRPANVQKAKAISFQDTGLHVRWGSRKVRAGRRRTDVYFFEWTHQPPDWIRYAMSSWASWSFTSKNVASSVNRWLKARGYDWTSTAPRDALSTRLRMMVYRMEMTATEFANLLDHNVETSGLHYSVE